MGFDSEEMARRRRRRKEQQERRRKEQRRLLIGLIAAGVILVLCAVLVIVVRNASREDEKPSETQPQTTAAPETQAASAEKTVIHFAATGDLNITDKTVAAGGAEYDYSRVFQDVVPVLANADLTVVNLEGNFSGAPYGGQGYSAPTSLLTALSQSGVDMLQMANSRTISNGILGLNTTLREIRAAGLEPVGAFANSEHLEESRGFTLYEVQGVKVAVVAFTKGMDGMGLPAGSEGCVNLLYTDYSSTYRTVDTEGITEILRAVALEEPDVTIALLHWGSEYNDTHSDTQETIRKLMHEQGVDAIIGTHPHYVQEMIFDPDAGTFIAYSLGDFLSDGERPGTEYSVVLDLEITKDNTTGETKITGYSYTPVFTVAEEDGTLRVVRLEAAMAAFEAGHIQRVSRETYDAMAYALERIKARVKG